MWYEQIEEEFQEDEMVILAYIEATYIGRSGPVERRRPLFEREWRSWSRERGLGASGQTTP